MMENQIEDDFLEIKGKLVLVDPCSKYYDSFKQANAVAKTASKSGFKVTVSRIREFFGDEFCVTFADIKCKNDFFNGRLS